MEILTEIYLSRAESEIVAARILLEISDKEELQKEEFSLEKRFTFYSNVISSSYYAIFYSAKAILNEEGVKTDSPNVHIKTLEAFESRLVRSGKLDVELLRLYKRAVVQADELMGIYSQEKVKRGTFTYKSVPQANLEPARESLNHASFFFKHILGVLKKRP